MACKYNDTITPSCKESIEDMSNSLNITKPRSYGTSVSTERNNSVLFSSTNQRRILHRVEMTDTLQGLSIKYNVTLESIKLLNKIWTSTGLYALREIQIPVCDESSNSNDFQSNTLSGSSASDSVIDAHSTKVSLPNPGEIYDSAKLIFNSPKQLTTRIIHHKSGVLEREKEKMNKFEDEFYNL